MFSKIFLISLLIGAISVNALAVQVARSPVPEPESQQLEARQVRENFQVMSGGYQEAKQGLRHTRQGIQDTKQGIQDTKQGLSAMRTGFVDASAAARQKLSPFSSSGYPPGPGLVARGATVDAIVRAGNAIRTKISTKMAPDYSAQSYGAQSYGTQSYGAQTY